MEVFACHSDLQRFSLSLVGVWVFCRHWIFSRCLFVLFRQFQTGGEGRSVHRLGDHCHAWPERFVLSWLSSVG